jgi:hypothetical protein
MASSLLRNFDYCMQFKTENATAKCAPFLDTKSTLYIDTWHIAYPSIQNADKHRALGLG